MSYHKGTWAIKKRFTIVIFLLGGVLRILMYMNLLFIVWAKEGMMKDKWLSWAPVTDVDKREVWPLIQISKLLYPTFNYLCPVSWVWMTKVLILQLITLNLWNFYHLRYTMAQGHGELIKACCCFDLRMREMITRSPLSWLMIGKFYLITVIKNI